MTYGVRWDLLAPVDVAGSVMQGVRAGLALREHREDRAFQMEERKRQAGARSAMSDYLLAGQPQPNALAPVGPVAPARGAFNALAPSDRPAIMAGGNGETPGMPPVSAWTEREMFGDPAAAPPVAGASLPTALDPSVGMAATVRPSTARNDAFARLAEIDPEAAINMRRQIATMDREQVERLRTLNDYSMQLLGSAVDQPSYDRALADFARVWQQNGGDPAVLESIPRQYSPETVQSLRLRGAATAQQLSAARQERRLDWDIEDDQIDNEALEEYRGETLDVRRRGQDIGSSDRRRGQDIGSTDRRRGQDQSSTDRRRGQDTTSRDRVRGQDIGSRDRQRGQDLRGRRGGGRGVQIRPGEAVARLPDGRRAVVRGGQWVPAE